MSTSTSSRNPSAPAPPSSSSSTTTPSKPPQQHLFPVKPYTPSNPTGPFPYTAQDFIRSDESSDESFYSSPRYVTHIDDHAIAQLKRYYAAELPRRGQVLDLCSSWISHFPPELEELARRGRKGVQEQEKRQTGQQESNDESLEVIGLGLSAAELSHNPILSHTIVRDLNAHPSLPALPSVPSSSQPSKTPQQPQKTLNATVCVVSIDYLTQPLPVLSSIRTSTHPGGQIHLILSNRCFPTKAVGRWLRISEAERVKMVADYLWWSGWRKIEVVEVCDGRRRPEDENEGIGGESGGGGDLMKGGLEELLRRVGLGSDRVDPLWVVRGVNVEGVEGEEGESKGMREEGGEGGKE